MFCSKCGSYLKDGYTFCDKCGARTDENAPDYEGYTTQFPAEVPPQPYAPVTPYDAYGTNDGFAPQPQSPTQNKPVGTYIALAASVIINIVLAIVLIVTLTGKDAKSEDDEDDKSYTESASVEEQLLGTWEVTNDSVLKLTFCDDGTCIAAGYDTNDYYEYEIDGSTLVMTMDGYTKRFEYSLSGNSLILTDKSGERLSLIKK